jgi:N-acetylglutamate synthase-like GNAT family acetyltransferase
MKDTSMQIREANTADIPLLSRLIRESFRDVAERFCLTAENCPKHPSNCTDAWVENDLKRGVAYFILEKDNTAAGCVALEKASADVCYLGRLAVAPRCRKNGFVEAEVKAFAHLPFTVALMTYAVR